MPGRILDQSFLADCCTHDEGWSWLGQHPRWLVSGHAMVLVDESCGGMGFNMEVLDPYRIRELLVRAPDEIVLTEDVTRRIPYRAPSLPNDPRLDPVDEDIGQRAYTNGSFVVCAQDRLGQLLDGLTVKYGGTWAGLAGYKGDELVAIVMELADPPREVCVAKP